MSQSATPTEHFCEEDRAARRRRLNKQAQKACRARKKERRRFEEDGQSSCPRGDAVPNTAHILTKRGDSAVEGSPSSQSDIHLGYGDDIMAMVAAGVLPDFFSAGPTLGHADPMEFILDEWRYDAVSQDTQHPLPPSFPDSLAPVVGSEPRDVRHRQASTSCLPDLGLVDGASRCFDAVDQVDRDIRMELEARVRNLNAKIWDLAVLVGRWGHGHMES